MRNKANMESPHRMGLLCPQEGNTDGRSGIGIPIIELGWSGKAAKPQHGTSGESQLSIMRLLV